LYHYADSIYGSGKSVGNTVTYNVASPMTTLIYQIMPPVLDTSNYSAITGSVTINRLLITTGNLILSWTGLGQTSESISLGEPTATFSSVTIPSFNGSRYSLDGLYNFTVTYNDITSLSSLIGVYPNSGFTVIDTITQSLTFNFHTLTITGTGFTQSLVGMYAKIPTISTYLFYMKRCTSTTIYGYFVDYEYNFTPMAWTTSTVNISGFTYGSGQAQTQNILVDEAGGFSVLKFKSNMSFDIIAATNNTYSYTFIDAGNGNANSLTFTSGPEDWFNGDVFATECTNIPITYSPTTTTITTATTVTFTCSGVNYTYSR
jgi:hypothetical protein